MPGFPEPWRKNLTGGSDDHSSLTITRIHTEVSGAASLQEFFSGLHHREAKIIGRASSPHTLAHNIYSIAYQFYSNKLGLHDKARYNKFLKFLDKALTNSMAPKKSIFSQVSLALFKKKAPASASSQSSRFSFLDLVKEEITKFIQEDPQLKKFFRNLRSGTKVGDQEWFDFIKQLSNKLIMKFNQRLVEGLSGAHFIDLFQSLTVMGIIYLMLLPYFAAFNSFSQDRHFSQEIFSRFMDEATGGQDNQAAKLGHFTDTFYEINGVALTLQKQVSEAQLTGKPYTVVTCDTAGHPDCECIQNFNPLAVWDLPEYHEQKLFHPPLLEMMDFCYQQRFTQILAATPGPMGLAGLFIARLLDLPIDGTYHTSLPQYAQYLTEDSTIEELMWRYILWFYNQMNTIYSPSASTASELADRGISPEKIRTFPRGVDLYRFNPAKRNGFLESHYNASEGLKLLYVGRVSKEKNLPLLVRTFNTINESRPDVQMIVVGDGPYLEEMKQALADKSCIFTGYLDGDDLCAVYASSDLFVFPSTTDTFGNVVLEAQASGIPVIVTDAGGPQENMLPGQTGLVVKADDEAGFTEAILSLIDDPVTRRRMSQEARVYIENRSFEQAFNATWEIYQGVCRAVGS